MDMRDYRLALLTATAMATFSASTATAQTAASGAAQAATPAAQTSPQTADDAVKDIVVTGTLIRGVAPVGSSIIGVSRADIVQSGLATTEDILKSVPQISSVGPSANSGSVTVQNSNLNNTRAESINIRGIGPQATLPLLNGRRLPAQGSGGQLFDAASLPTIALSRIDVVADGASATYGSDAVAGVANFILRTDVNGLEANARYSFADDVSGNYQASVIAGHRWSSGAIMAAFQYDRSAELLQSDRPGYFQCDERPYGYTNSCVAANGSAQTANITAPGNLVFPTGTTRVYGLPAGSGTGVTAAQLSTTPNVASNTRYRAILPDTRRYSGVFASHVDLGAVTLWSEGYYSRRNNDIDNGYLTFSSPVPTSNPNFVVVPGQSGATETVQYSLQNDGGAVRVRTYSQSWQAAAGFDAKLGENFKATVYYEHNNNHEFLTTPATNSNLLAAALACTGSVCFNPYGSGGSAANQTAAASFIGKSVQNAFYDSNLVNGKIDGSLFHLAGGDVKLAVGGEWHWDKILNYNFSNTAASSTTLDTIFVSANSRYARKVTSAFGELVIPIFGADNERAGFHRLTIDIAGRYDHYSDVGSTTNPKIGVTWAPTRDFTLRGSYGTSFRAPTVCDVNPLCTNALLTNAAAITSLYNQRNSNSVTLVGGNGSVQPETATTFSGGIDFKPERIRGLAISLNYFNIDYKGVIYTPGNSSSSFTNPLYAQYITANPSQAQVAALVSLPFFTGFPTLPGCATLSPSNTSAYQCIGAIVNGTRSNAGEEKLSGLDINASYRTEASFGRLTFGVFATYLFNYDISVVKGAPFVNTVNQFSSVNAPLGDLLRFRGRAQIGYGRGGFDANIFVNYSNAYHVIGLVNPSQNDRVGAYTTADLGVSYAFGRDSGPLHGLRLSVNVINITNTKPPLAVVATTQQYDPGVANILGRQVALQIGKKF